MNKSRLSAFFAILAAALALMAVGTWLVARDQQGA